MMSRSDVSNAPDFIRVLLTSDHSLCPSPLPSGKARLVPLSSYHLSPALEPDLPEPAAEPTAKPTWVDVGKAFGLARWQKNHSRAKRLMVGSGTRSVADSLTAAAQHVEPAEEEEVAPIEAGLVPPQTVDAEQPEGVYNREDVMPHWLCGRLQRTADEFEKALEKHSAYVCLCLCLCVYVFVWRLWASLV